MHVFGEVLFDCFPSGETVLGGAPFNVAWHLQALGDQPRFVSRIGRDPLGEKIVAAMDSWGLDTTQLQVDSERPTGQVQIEIDDGEPSYDIRAGAAYDYIDASQVTPAAAQDIVYHGSLALRHEVSREALLALTRDRDCAIFMDVNLRDPWWERDRILGWLERARWAKMNEHELQALGFDAADMHTNMDALQAQFPQMEHVIVTRGRQGALIRTRDGAFHEQTPPPEPPRVDTVGAGDSFSAAYLHGLRAGWPVMRMIEVAQGVAAQIIGVRGATPRDPAFYAPFK